MPSTRAASRIACLPLIVAKVTICATRSSPYLRTAYRSTSPRPRTSKSMSMSGISLRAGFRKRSNISRYLIGSMPTIPRQYDTIEPAELPRPGPQRTPFAFAYAIRSATIKKYEANPMDAIVDSSNSIRSRTSSVSGSPYRAAAPSYVRRRRYVSTLSPVGVSKTGNRWTPISSVTLHRSAISRVASHASGWSRNSARICSGDFRKNSSASNLKRPGSLIVEPVWMHNRTS